MEDDQQLSQLVCHLKDDPQIITSKNKRKCVSIVDTKTDHSVMGVNLKVAMRPSTTPINISALAGMSRETTNNHATSLKVVGECRIDLNQTSIDVEDTKKEMNFESKLIMWIQNRTRALAKIAIRAARDCGVKPKELDRCKSSTRKTMQDHAWSYKEMDLAVSIAKHFDLDSEGKQLADERVRISSLH